MHALSLMHRLAALATESGRALLLVAVFMCVAGATAIAQPLAGTYTIGGAAPNYATIEAAITDLNARGVSAPVTFAIRSGTYTPPATGYVLSQVATMTSTNTVTFRPDANAVVTVDGTLSVPIFDFSGGDYYVLDGWGGAGLLKRDWKIIQRGTGQAIRFINGAQFNTVRNANIVSNATGSTTGHISFSTSTGVGNSYNTITANTIGDSTATLRSSCGIYLSGTSTGKNGRNKIDDNDIINLGYSGGFIYGVYISGNNDSTLVTRNRIRVTNVANSPSVYPLYGVYYTNTTTTTYDTIAYNRIWDLRSQYTTATTYGIYISSASANPVAIHNNMIALNGDVNGATYGIYISTSSTTNFTVDYNSIEVTSTIGLAYTSAALYMSSSANVTARNNVLSTTRFTAGATTSYCVYRGSTLGTFTSNNNVFYHTGVGTTMGYSSPTVYATLATWQAGTGRDVNSRTGNPRFVSVPGGDLHISGVQRTPVEGAGTAIPGLTLDFDGNTRSATTPDVGADEGTFLALFNNDMMADRFVAPLNGGIVLSNTAFSPTAIATNAGALAQVNVPVRYRIINASSTVVYSDVQNIASLGSGSSTNLTFNAVGNQLGSTTLPAGVYTIELTTQLPGDQDPASDVITATITVKDPLNGVYTINRTGVGVRNFTSFTAAIAELNGVGVSGPVTFEIANGTYDASFETFPFVLRKAAGMSATNTVTFRPAVGANPLLTGSSPLGSAIFVLDSARNYVFEGSNTVGGNTRNWTIRQTEPTANPTFWLRNDADNNTIRNCIVQGSASASTKTSSSAGIGIVYIGVTTAANGNDSNLVMNCTIGDAAGTFRNNVGVGIYGTSGKPNRGNRILGCDIINFGNATSNGYGVVAYAEQAGTVVQNCDIHNTIPAPSAVTTLYGIYTDYSPGYPISSVFDRNRIYKLTSQAANWTVYGIYHWVSTSTNVSTITNNMISFTDVGDHTYYGIYVQSSSGTANFTGNTVFLGGTATGSRAAYLFYKVSSCTTNLRNNIWAINRTGGTGSNYGLYVSSTTAWNSNFNQIVTTPAANYYAGYYSAARATLADFQTASGQDLNSLAGTVTFVDPANGDLHVNPQPIFTGEGMAVTGTGVTTDFDAQTRDAVTPDIGADEGNFNGGGLRVTSPNGGERYSVDYNLDVLFTANRPMPVRVDFSTNGGATWTNGPTANAVRGNNTVTIVTPSQITSTARVRVISTLNQWEADTSDNNFELVLPVFTVLAMNGGETLVPTDTTKIRWTSQFAPVSMRLQLDYSTDGGSTWTLIDNNIYTNNLPATNSYDWIVPNAPTTQARVRIKVVGGTIFDASDANFTIIEKPSVKVVTPNGGEKLFVSEVNAISWTSVNTTSVFLEYTTDGGSTWSAVVPGGITLPAYLGTYPWTIPNTPSPNSWVRITNVERPRFADTSDAAFEIARPLLQVTSPNGGEKYEIGSPVTVYWNSQNGATLRLDYSDDGGTTWTTILGGLPAASGSYTFTPPPIPTKLALVRLVDEDRAWVNDRSDAPFEIREPRQVTVYTPTTGDMLVRNSTTVITWDAPNISQINILYSSNGGGSWTTILSNVNASEGSRVWTVPNQLTTQGKIRIQEVGGPAQGESGLFSIVDVAAPAVTVIAPNGGEKYQEGSVVTVRWSSTGIATVSIFYTTDDVNWTLIASGVTASNGQYPWTANVPPGTNYRVKVESSTGTPSDQSNGKFEITRKLAPQIVVLYPNGGENLSVDSIVRIRWTAQDITGPVRVEWTKDTGSTKQWLLIGTPQWDAGTLDWTVPDSITTTARVRVFKGSGGGNGGVLAADTSDADFEISRVVPPQLLLTAPDGGETWYYGNKRMITWDNLPSVANLDIAYSTDNGNVWIDIEKNVPMIPNQYEWTVPTLTIEAQNTAQVRISNSANPAQSDKSNAPFSILKQVAGVDAVAGASALQALGNVPNPFNGSTELRWSQATSGTVEVRLFEANGLMVRSYDAGRREPGVQGLTVSGDGLSSGMYIYEIRVAGAIVRGVMLLAR